MKHLHTPESALQHLFRCSLLLLWFGCGLGLTTGFGQISGTVFRDFDGSGTRTDTLLIEPGVANVTVRAYVGFVTTPITTTTNAGGGYAFTAAQISPGSPVRIEFDGLADGEFVGHYGTGSGSLVQFATAPSTSVSVGISYPADYCQPGKLTTIVPCYINGNVTRTTYDDGSPIPDDKQAGKADVLVVIDYDAKGAAGPTNFPPEHIASGAEVGAVWGLAYQRRTGTMVVSSVIKRHTSLGPLGTGGLYQYNVNTKTLSQFADVKTLGIDTGDDPKGDMSGDKTQANADPESFSLAGRTGLGGLDFSEDDKTLYLMNLKDRTLYALPVGLALAVPTAGSVKSYPIPNPGCPNNDFRPWAVKVHRKKLYIGVVCTGETSGDRNELKGIIYRMDPAVATPVFEQVLNFPLTFKRAPVDTTYKCIDSQYWLPWSNLMPIPCNPNPDGNNQFVLNPQPLISDLEFDDSDGSIMIGMADRFGFMVGTQNHNLDGTGIFDGVSGGDLLRAAPNTAGTGYDLENNGVVGGRTGKPGSDGPGGGAFYWDKFWRFFGGIPHGEVLTGSLVMVPGRGEVAASAYDPIDQIWKSGGFRFMNNKTGAQNRPGYAVYSYGAPSTFGKASGLGDSKPICGPAPVEIGNRLWYDTNRNGIQDPFEPGIDGITLTLNDLDQGGKEVGRTTTKNSGQYYFNNSNVAGNLLPLHRYQVRYSFADIVAKQPKGARVAARTYFLSPKNAGTGIGATSRDSDPFIQLDSAVVNASVNDYGENDHSFDLAVYSCPTVTASLDTIQVCAARKIPEIDGMLINGEFIDSVRYVLFDTPQTSTTALYAGGKVLGTVKPAADGTANLLNPDIPTSNTTSQPIYKYVYAVLYPQALAPTCQPSDLTVLKINPETVLTATGGALTCVPIKGQLAYKDGTPVPNATYAWTGPNNFTANTASTIVSTSGAYTLTAFTSICPDNRYVTTALVSLDQTPPALTAHGGTLPAPSGSIKLFASASAGASLRWSGPNGFSSTAAEPTVTQAGTYIVKATGLNGCPALADVIVTQDVCEPQCVPLAVERLR